MNSIQPTFADSRLYTAAEVRELDRCAIEDHGIPGIDLMERAGKAAFDVIRSQFPGRKSWLVVCGGGNNGGDGYVIARLARESGIQCRLFALKSPGELRGDAALAAEKWHDAGGTSQPGTPEDTDDIDLMIDALLGTGLDRAAEGHYAVAINAMNNSVAPVVAVDIPSGLNADTGSALGDLAVRAELTITFIGRKRGLFTADGPDHAGLVHYASLDVPEDIFKANNNSGELIREDIVRQFLPKRPRNSHKGHYGWLLGVGGDHGMSGAMRLCGEAALRTGAGKVTLLTHPVHAATLNIGCPELMVRGISDTDETAKFLEGADVVVLGPGLGQGDWSRAMLRASVGFNGPMVLDADALNLLASDPGVKKMNPGKQDWVLTPHPAEAARLLKTDSRAIQKDRVGAAIELAGRSQSVVVLKGCGSVVANPDGDYAICPLGNPGMASGGTGDVLSGVIGAMLAQGLDAWSAARAGVVVHACAGDQVAARTGERGLLASDMIDQLPRVVNPDS